MIEDFEDPDDEPLSAQDLVLIEAGADPHLLRAISARATLRPWGGDEDFAWDGELIPVVTTPGTRATRRQWALNGLEWPRDERGRLFPGHHKKALADGGADTPDNIEPMHPREHHEHHKANGDFSRWGRRAGIARAFGGRVARSVPGLGALSTLTGVLSGRIRPGSLGDLVGEMLGPPAQLELELNRQRFDPNRNFGGASKITA